MTGMIFDIKEMAVHDGPGLRTTVFLKGCPLRCRWCHNPEGLSSRRQLMVRHTLCTGCGKCRVPCSHPECEGLGRCIHACPSGLVSASGQEIEAEKLARQLLDSAFVLGEDFGGVTFSGGEPLLQWPFLLECIEKLDGVHTCIETSGYALPDVFRAVLSRVDYVIMDLKLAEDEKHLEYTGVSNSLILKNLCTLQESGKAHILRTPLIPGITDTQENLEAIRTLAGESRWETLPYNTMAGAKYKMLGMEYTLWRKE